MRNLSPKYRLGAPSLWIRPVLLAGVLSVAPFTSGFVLLTANKATLQVTPEAPTVTFHWNGATPGIKEKDKFQGGEFQDLSDKDFMEQLLKASLGVWNDVPGKFVKLELVEDTAASLNADDQQHSIVVQHSSNVTTAAYAAPQILPDNPEEIVDCDINISDRSTKAKELAFTLVHELGHCLGLGHAHTDYNAMMGYSRTKRNLSLGADDIAGVIYLYPDPAYVDGEPKEYISCAVIPGRADFATNLGILLVLVGMPLLIFTHHRLKGLPAKAKKTSTGT